MLAVEAVAAEVMVEVVDTVVVDTATKVADILVDTTKVDTDTTTKVVDILTTKEEDIKI